MASQCCYYILISNGFSSHYSRPRGPHKSDGLTVKAPILPRGLLSPPPSVIPITTLDSRSSRLLPPPLWRRSCATFKVDSTQVCDWEGHILSLDRTVQQTVSSLLLCIMLRQTRWINHHFTVVILKQLGRNCSLLFKLTKSSLLCQWSFWVYLQHNNRYEGNWWLHL